MRNIDVGVGAFFSNMVMFFIILTTAITLNRHGITNIATSRQAAEALRPFAGNFAATLFTLGIVGVGFLAIPTLAGSTAYAFAETLGWRQGLNKKLKQARWFYALILVSTAAGVALDFIGINPVKALYWTAVINGLLAPFLLVAILIVAADKKLMQNQPSSRLGWIVVAITTVAMFVAGRGDVCGVDGSARQKKQPRQFSPMRTRFGEARKFLRAVGLAQAADLPNPETDTNDQQCQRTRKAVGSTTPEVCQTTCVQFCVRRPPKPGNEGVTQAASRAVDGEEAPARDAQRAGGKRERQERNGRRKHGGKKDRKDSVTFHPSDDSSKKTRRHITAQRRFAASPADVPGGISAQDAACDGTGSQQPGISAVRHQPKQQQVSAAGQR